MHSTLLVLLCLVVLASQTISTPMHKPGCTRLKAQYGSDKETMGTCSGHFRGFPRRAPKKIVDFITKYFGTLSECDIPALTALLATDFQSFEEDGDVIDILRQRRGIEGFCQGYPDAKFEPIRITSVSPRVVYMVMKLSSDRLKNGAITYAQSMTLVPCGDSFVVGQDMQSLSGERLQRETKTEELRM